MEREREREVHTSGLRQTVPAPPLMRLRLPTAGLARLARSGGPIIIIIVVIVTVSMISISIIIIISSSSSSRICLCIFLCTVH